MSKKPKKTSTKEKASAPVNHPDGKVEAQSLKLGKLPAAPRPTDFK
jgi:hypothetical protein